MPKKKEQPPQLPANVVVTGIPGPRGEPSVLNGDYELEEGQEMNGCARWKSKNSEEGDFFVFFDGNAWCVGNLEDTLWIESSNTNKWGHPLGLQWVVAGSTGAEVAVCAG